MISALDKRFLPLIFTLLLFSLFFYYFSIFYTQGIKILNKLETNDQISEYLKNISKSKPEILWKISCFHSEMTYSIRSKLKRKRIKVERKRESFSKTKIFPFINWENDFNFSDIKTNNIFEVEKIFFDKKISFNSVHSSKNFEKQKNIFLNRFKVNYIYILFLKFPYIPL